MTEGVASSSVLGTFPLYRNCSVGRDVVGKCGAVLRGRRNGARTELWVERLPREQER